MAVGGLAVASSFASRISVDVETINYLNKTSSKVKWSKAKPLRLGVYLSYIDLLFELIKENMVHVHLRFQEMGEYDHNLSGERKKIDTISKAHYQLMLHRAVRYYGGEAGLHLRPDDGVCTERLPKFLDRLNDEGERKFGHSGPCVKTIEPRNSAKEPLLQLLDVTLGALTAYKNKRHIDPRSSEHKKQLAEYAFEKTGLPSLDVSTPISQANFSIWNVTPSLSRAHGPRG